MYQGQHHTTTPTRLQSSFSTNFFHLLLIFIFAPITPAFSRTIEPFTIIHAKVDFGSWRSVLPFVWLIIFLPLMLLTLILLIIRRRHYPIAGRGFSSLLATHIVTSISFLCSALTCMYWPTGIPCGIQFFEFYLIVLLAGLFVVRGIMLVWRLEIMNYLQEMRWREEQRMEMEECEEMMALVQPSAGGGSDESCTNTLPPSLLALDCQRAEDYAADGTLLNHGRWFVEHRRYSEPRRLFKILLMTYAIIGLGMSFLAIWDPDIPKQDELLRENGLLGPAPESYGRVFSHSFSSGPPCIRLCIKSMFCYFFVGIMIFPAAIWILRRIYQNKKRTKYREEKQKEWKRKIRQWKMQQRVGDEENEDADEALHAEGKRNTASSGVDMNDIGRLMKELIIMGIGALCCTILLLMGIGSYFVPFAQAIFVYLLAWVAAIVWPLKLSFTISRKHREMIRKGRAETSTISNESQTAKPRHYGDPARYTNLMHHKPYYNLTFLLRSSHTYPVLLQFLQKEFSSENAMFWNAAQDFTKFVRKLERSIPGWNAMAEHEASSVAPGVLAPLRIEAALERDGHLHEKGETGGMSSASNRIGSASPGRTDLVSFTEMASASIPSGSRSTAAHPNGSPPFDGNIASVSSLARPAQRTHGSASVGSGGGGYSSRHLRAPTAAQSNGWMTPTESARHSRNPSAESSRGDRSPSRLPVAAPASASAPAPAAQGWGRSLTFNRPPSRLKLQNLHKDAAKAKSWALKIYADYIKRGTAMFEINVPATEANLVGEQIAALQKWNPTPSGSLDANNDDLSDPPIPPPFPLSRLYSRTSTSIFDLIQKDSFRRFILTREFQRLLEEADEEELARVEKQQDVTINTAAIIENAISMQQIQRTNERVHGVHGRTSSIGSRIAASTVGGGGGGGNADSATPLPPLPGTPIIHRHVSVTDTRTSARNDVASPRLLLHVHVQPSIGEGEEVTDHEEEGKERGDGNGSGSSGSGSESRDEDGSDGNGSDERRMTNPEMDPHLAISVESLSSPSTPVHANFKDKN